MKETHRLINDRKYEGQYVALRAFNNNAVVAYGAKPEKARKAAIKKGVERPVIIYVPRHDTTYIY